MSLNEFLNQLRRRIPERHARVKSRQKSRLRVMGLEQRKLLDATAAFVLGELSLAGFDSGDVLTVSENMGSLDFQLTGGNIWGSTAGAGLSLVDPSTLRLSGTGVGDLDELNITATVADALAAVNVNTALQLTNLQIANGGVITALDASNDFDAVSLSGSRVDLVDADDLTINVVTASAGIDITAVSNVTINADVSSGAGVDIESTVGTLQLTAGNNISATSDVFLDAGTAIDIDGTIGFGVAVGANVNVATDIDSATVSIDGDIAADGAISIGSSSLTGAISVGAGTTVTADSNNLGAESLSMRTDGMITQADGGSLLSHSGNVLIQSDLSDIEVGGITATTGSIELTAVAGSISDSGIDTSVDLTAGSTITLTAQGSISELELASGSDLTASSTLAGDVSLNALGAISLTDVSTQNGKIEIDAGGTITATDVNASATDDGANDISLTTTAGDILLGVVNAGTDNDVILISAGAIAEVTADTGVDLVAGDAEMLAATGIGSGDAIETSVTNLAFRNSTSGHVSIRNASDLNIAAVGSLLTSSNSAGNVTLDAMGTVTFNASLTASGVTTVNAIESIAANAENIVVADGVTVESTSGDVVFSAGDRITISANANVTASATGTQEITFNSGVADMDLDGSMTLNGNLTAGSVSGIISLDTNNQQGVVQNSTGTISTDGLVLISDAAGGVFDLDQSSTNTVNAIAADTDGTIAFRNSSALQVRTINAMAGVTTSSDDVTICATSIALAASVSIGTGSLRLSASAGAVEQSGGSIIAANLGSAAAGNVTLTSTTNDVNTFAATSTSGYVSFTDADGFIVGTISGSDCFTEVVGVTASTGSGDVVLEARNGNVTNSGANPDVIAADLSVTATGSIRLDTTVASLNLSSTSAGDISINESNAVELVTVNNANGAVAVTAAGTMTATSVTAVNGNLTLNATAGDVLVGTLTADSLGAIVDVTANGSVSDLNSDGAVDISAVMGSVFVDAGGDIGAAAPDILKSLAPDPLEIDSASMALTAGGDIAVHQTTATVVSNLVGDTVMLSSDGAVDLSTATPTATNLALLTSGSRVTLPASVNMVTGDLRIEAGDVADTGGTIDLNAARILFKSGQSEVISITADAFDGQSAGNLTVNSDSASLVLTDLDCDLTAINVGSNIAVLNSNAPATISQDLPATPGQNSRILSGSLVLNGQGTWNLTNGDNDTSILAADNAGDIVFKDLNDVTVDAVVTPDNGTVNGVTAAGASVLLDVGTTLNIDQQLSADDDVRLQANGTILQTAAGIITATNLGIRQLAPNGGIQLAAQNDVEVFAAENAADGGAITFADRDELSIGSVSATSVLDAAFAGASGVLSSNGNVTLDTGTPASGTNSLSLTEAVTAGAADVRIIADGNVTQTTTGVITADSLGIRQEDVLAGSVVLDQANVVSSLAAANLADGGIVAFHNEQSLTVETVSGLQVSASPTTAAVDFAESNGVTTSSGDVLLDVDGALIIEQQVNAGDAAIRINTDGTISQSVTGEIVAMHLGIQQNGVSGNVMLGDAGNDVDILAITNVAEAGAVTFFDADDLTINEVASLSVGQLDFVAASGIDTNAGDISLTSTTDLTIERRIDAVHETLSTSIDESVTLVSRSGDFVLADGVVITTDENPTPGIFDDVTGDEVTIVAGSSGTNGTVSLGADIEVRTDGGVAKQISPRPTAFSAAPTTGAENAFVTLSDAEHMRSNLLFQNGEFLGVLDLVFGVAGEENLEVVVDWGAISQTSLTASGAAGDATLTPNGFEFDLSDADKTIFYIDEGGTQHLIPHVYSVTDLMTTSSDRNGRQINPNIFGVRFSVAQHESINIWGASATDPGTGTTETPSIFSSTASVTPVIDATGTAIDVLSPGLALLSSTDTNPLNEFGQQAAPLPFGNGVVTPTGTPEELAEWEFIAGPTPGLIPYEPTERPTLEIPKIEAPFDPAVVSEIVGDVSFTAGAASDSAIGTQVYLQIRRYFELDSEAEVVIARITNNTFISNRDSFDQFVRDNPELQDGAGYEVWLVTETSGQRVERPIVKFEITGGRPGPATEELPETFEPYELRDLEFEQPETDEQPVPNEDDMSAIAPKVPVHTVDYQLTRQPVDVATEGRLPEHTLNQPTNDESSASAHSKTDESNAAVVDAASVLVPTLVFTKAARWKRRQADKDHDVSRTGRTIRRMKQKVAET